MRSALRGAGQPVSGVRVGVGVGGAISAIYLEANLPTPPVPIDDCPDPIRPRRRRRGGGRSRMCPQRKECVSRVCSAGFELGAS